VKREAKSVRCTRDARQIPWQSYVLAGEGNKARDRAVAEQRCSLALQLPAAGGRSQTLRRV